MSVEQTVVGLRTRSVRGGLATLVAQLFKFMLTLGSQICMARLLAPADFGIVALVAPVIAFLGLFSDFGLLQAVVQRRDITQVELSAVFWINTALSLLIALGCAALSPLIAWFYHEPRLIGVVIALSCSIFVVGMSQMQIALANRTMRFTLLAVSEVIALACGIAAGIAAAWAGWRFWALVLSQIVTVGVTCAVVWAASPWRPARPVGLAAVSHILRFGSHITGTRLVGYLNQSCDNILVGAFLGETPLGIYDRAYKLAVLPLAQLTAPLERIAMPTLSRLTQDPPRYRSAAARMLQAMLLTTCPPFLFAALTARPLVSLVFGHKWDDMIPIFSWICVGALVTPINLAAFWLFVSQGRAREQMYVFAGVAVINFAAYAVGLHWGLVGVARCSAISVYCLQSPILVWAATRSGPMSFRHTLDAALPVVAALLASATALVAFERVYAVSTFFDLGIALCVVYLSGLTALIAMPQGRTLIGRFWSFRHDLRSRS